MPPDSSIDHLKRLLLVCGGLVTARIFNNEEGVPYIAVFCADGDEYAQAVALFHQALADEQLRQSIHQKCDPEIASLVTNILNRAAGT